MEGKGEEREEEEEEYGLMLVGAELERGGAKRKAAVVVVLEEEEGEEEEEQQLPECGIGKAAAAALRRSQNDAVLPAHHDSCTERRIYNGFWVENALASTTACSTI